MQSLLPESVGKRVIAVEVLLKRPALDCTIPVGTESTGKHADVTERRLERLVQNVGHLVLKILRRNKRVDELATVLDHGMDLTAGATEIGVIVESLPEVVQRLVAWLGTGVNEHAEFRLQMAAKRVEEPTVTIDLLAVLLLETEDHLDGDQVGSVIAMRLDERGSGVDRKLGCVFEEMGYRVLTVDFSLHNTILVDTDGSEEVKNLLVAWVNAIKDETDHDPLPARSTLFSRSPPKLRSFTLADVTNVEHDTVQRPRKQDAVLVVVGDGNQQLRISSVLLRGAKTPAVFECKLVRVARSRGVAHMRELLGAATLCPLGLHRVLDSRGHGVVDYPVASCELDLLGETSLGCLLTLGPGYLTGTVFGAEAGGIR